MILALFGGQKGGLMEIAIRAVIDIPNDDPFVKDLDKLLAEFKGYIEPHYYIKEFELDHGEDEQRKR